MGSLDLKPYLSQFSVMSIFIGVYALVWEEHVVAKWIQGPKLFQIGTSCLVQAHLL
jgi:hypothetical protein